MFWRSSKQIPAVQPAEEDVAPRGVDLDTVLDALGTLVRAIGGNAFDMNDLSARETKERFERWAQHVTIGGAHPEAGKTTSRRDFPGLKKFVTDHRREEQRFVVETIPELRGFLWTLVQTIERSVSVEQDADTRAKAQLTRLQIAAKERPIEDLKREVMSTVEALDGILSERKRRQEEQLTQIASRMSAMRKQLEEVQRESELDPLTKLGNRRAFDERLGQIASLSTIGSVPSCLLMIDIDHFKAVNDKHGHMVGDSVLVAVADVLSRSFLRRCDFVARFGGEEFAVVLHETNAASARALAERVLEKVRALRFTGSAESIRPTVSVGVAQLGPAEAPAVWLERADRALYAAKEQGRDRVVAAATPTTSGEISTPLSPRARAQ